MNKKHVALLFIIIISIVVLIYTYLWNKSPNGTEEAVHVSQSIASNRNKGKDLFIDNCSQCHGKDLMGTDSGPPFIHKIYESSHHSDISFLIAVKEGVKSHHWSYGDMPAISGLSEGDVKAIIKYIRDIQKQNGIE